MSISISKIVNLPQAALKFLVQDEIEDEPTQDFATIGGVFSGTDYAWLSNGPRLEVVHTKSGNKVGAWTFGWVLKDSYTEVVCVDEIQRPHGRPPLLAVGVDCAFNGGMICIFDFITSKIIRAIQIKDKITKLHVIDAGHDVFTLPGPLRNFDGIIAVGTAGGDVFLIDICRQICDEALTAGGLSDIRDELNPCQLNNITSKDISKIELHKEFAVRNSQHLAIHLNIVFDKSTKHFILKGPKGDDRIHVNADEVTVSALFYCPQLGSLLIGYNFGALQLYNLMNLELVYTSPVCDEHIPISHFALQEPSDDPRAFCYIWAVYSAGDQYSTCLPLAVLYAFCYHTKEYHEGYGRLYQDFNTAAVHYQMELGVPENHAKKSKPKGGCFLKLNSISQGSVNKEGPHCDSNEDNLTLCVLVWNVWFSSTETDTFVAIFDLNQWYKEQMPSVPNIQYSSTYMIQIPIGGLINSATNKALPVLDVHIDQNSIQQYSGPQRLEEHFCPNSISFSVCSLRENDIVHLHNFGVQKALLAQIESSGPLCLVEPAEVYQEVIGLGLIPLFIDLPANTPVTTNQQREIILGAALENQLMGWLCRCASDWANGSYLSAGCSLDLLISWAFQRAVTLKTHCDDFCVSLFDYSEARLDNNTNLLLNSCTRQLKNLCSLYAFITRKLYMFISNQEVVEEQFKSLQMVSVYFEVLQWLLNVGLLPECPLSAYPRSDDLDRISAPYPAEMLIDFYNHRRAILKIMNEENFSSSSSVLFIDTLIEKECGGKTLQEHWRNDGGNGLYPPPSLQALLRTYLIDNVELSFKHSVIIYVFLDLAMTLDQDRYKPVITHLIKFPAVFKVSPSLIKITQAFWQLDHGDYNTAMGLLLDPLVLNEDLSQWHHKVALRSLLLQKQHNFALLYVQVRKPVLSDDEDVLTAISLYVANNMLDEAFYFEKHFVDPSQGDKFLTHLFNECKKNDKIRSIIYRSLSSVDEGFFLKYLLNSKHSTAEDLHVYYHILRSHFMEAFESHERSLPKHIENQGLIGQENAVPRDKLVHYLKKLLPVVNRSLLNLCNKERNIVWQQVSRPTPMSVFIHNVNENVQYKSTLIAAALAKAKQTFNETMSDSFRLETEGTPFLRTPAVSAPLKRSSASVITPKVIGVVKETDEIVSPPSSKRLKLSPRVKSAGALSASIPSKLETPIVKRKSIRAPISAEEKAKVSTPHSILKVKGLNSRTPEKDESQFEDDFKAFEKLEYTPVSSKKSGLGLSPRKSLVRFEGLKNSSSSNLNASRNLFKSDLSDVNVSSTVNSHRLSGASSKNTSTEEEVFYSPNTSLEEKEETSKVNSVRQDEKLENEINESLLLKNGTKIDAEMIQKSVNDVKEITVNIEPNQSSTPIFSPKGRKSYKRSLGSITAVRSSPRLSKNAVTDKETPISSPQTSLINEVSESSSSLKDITIDNSDNTKEAITSLKTPSTNTTESISEMDSPKSSVTLPKLRPRKSLCRKVLETNTVNRLLNSPLSSPRSRRSKNAESIPQHQEIRKTEESVQTEHLESTVKYSDGEESYQSSMVKKHNLTTSFVESDLDTSEDFSINYEVAEEPKLLSASMLRYINRSTFGTDKELNESQTSSEKNDEELSKKLDEDKDTDNEMLKDKVTVGSVSEVEDKGDNESIDSLNNTNEISDTVNVANISRTNVAKRRISQRNKATDGEPHEDKSFGGDTTATSVKDESTYSVSESSAEIFSKVPNKESGPKLSESMIRYIDNFFTGGDAEEADNTQEEVKDVDEEAMDVDNGVDVYGDLSEDQDSREKTHNEQSNEVVDEELSSSKESKNEKEAKTEENEQDNKEEEKEESPEAETSNNGPVDPEMNVFEISDDLSINDGLIVEKEVTLEENDLCYDQQNTLESVLEENITVSSTPLKTLEKNVFTEVSSEEESNSDEDSEVDNLGEKHDADQGLDKSDNEVIEIGSSSEDDEKDKEESSEYSSEKSEKNSSKCEESDEEKLDVSYERNIYDTERGYSSESSCEQHSNEVSGNSDESKDDETEPEDGLFHGVILLEDDDEKKDGNVEESTKTETVDGKSKKELQTQPEEVSKTDTADEKGQECPSPDGTAAEAEENKPEEEELPQAKSRTTEPRIFSEYDSFEQTKDEQEVIGDVIEKDNHEYDQTQMQHGQLFYGAILLHDEGEKDGKDKSEGETEVETEIIATQNEEAVEKVESPTKMEEDTEEKSEGQEGDSNSKEKVEEQEKDVEEGSLHKEETKVNKDGGNDAKGEVSTLKQSEVNEGQGDEEIKSVEEEKTVTRPRTRSGSVSSTKSEKTTKKTRQQVSQDSEGSLTPRRSARRSNVKVENQEKQDSKLDKLKRELDIADDIFSKQTGRTLRSRRVSTEETRAPAMTMRKRSASVDEATISSRKSASKKEEKDVETEENEKSRGVRAASVSRLPIIAEENDDVSDVKRRRSKSVLENYSMNRRMTRQQMNLLKKTVDNQNVNLESLEPTVVLERLPSECNVEGEGKKIQMRSPSSSNSTGSSPEKSTRRLRSTSQVSEGGSQRSKSRTPVRSVKRGSRRTSADDVSNLSTQSNVGTSRKESKENVADTEENVVEPRTTRSRARSASLSSVNSEDSNISETHRGGKRKQKITSHSHLPEIKEESNQSEKLEIPKKRTRQRSSQK